MPFARRMRIAAAGTAALALAGCGSINGSTRVAVRAGTPAPPPLALCAAVSEVDSLTVTRLDQFPGNGLRFTFPPRIAASSPRQAQAVARAWCGLRQLPPGAYSCPADWGISYRLQFGATGRRDAVVTADATGCQTEGEPRFWRALGQATGVADSATAFRGCDAHGGQACPENATYR